MASNCTARFIQINGRNCCLHVTTHLNRHSEGSYMQFSFRAFLEAADISPVCMQPEHRMWNAEVVFSCILNAAAHLPFHLSEGELKDWLTVRLGSHCGTQQGSCVSLFSVSGMNRARN